MNTNHMLQISLGCPPSEGNKTSSPGRHLVHSTSDGHIEPPRGGFPEPLSAPAMAPSPGYNPFFMSDQGRSASTPTPPPMQGMSPTYTPIPRYTMNPITVTLSQNLPNAPQALQIPPSYNSNNSALYIRPSPSQSPQPAPWPSTAGPAVYQPNPYQTSSYPSHPSPYSSPQHQVPQTSHVFLPISPPTLQNMPYQQAQHPSMSYRPYLSKSSLKNQIEITLEGPRPRSNSPVHNPQGPSYYMATSPSPSSPSRAISMTGPAGTTFHHGVYLHQGPPRPRPASSPQPGSSAYSFKIKVSPGQPQRPCGSPPVEAEPLLNIVDQGERHGAPPPILPISAGPGSIACQIASRLPRRSSSGSDDYAYTQGMPIHMM